MSLKSRSGKAAFCLHCSRASPNAGSGVGERDGVGCVRSVGVEVLGCGSSFLVVRSIASESTSSSSLAQ